MAKQMAKQNGNQTQQSRTWVETLPVALTELQRLEIGREIGTLLQELDNLDGEKRAAADAFKARIEAHQATLRQLGGYLRSGTRPQPVELREIRRERTHEIEVVRHDTGELVRVRPMTAEERQETLPLAQAEIQP